MNRFLFGTTKEGQEVYAYTLENKYLKATILEYGAILASLEVKEKNNRDIVLGYDTLQDYEEGTAYIGATVGRCANRIAKGQFTWKGETRQLEINNGENHLHGGKYGCHGKVWTSFVEDNIFYLRTVLREREDGYPGDLEIMASFYLSNSELHVNYAYRSSTDSFANLTNHSYFSLEGTEDILLHKVKLNAPSYTPFTEQQIPIGEIAMVENTAFDLQKGRLMAHAFSDFEEDLRDSRGYDHNFILPKGEGLKLCGTIVVRDLSLEVWSDAPAFQFYTGNWIPESKGKGGRTYGPYSGLCIEPQFVPNAINMPQFESPCIKGGKSYERRIVYKVHTKG